jgi:hypothetical protein
VSDSREELERRLGELVAIVAAMSPEQKAELEPKLVSAYVAIYRDLVHNGHHADARGLARSSFNTFSLSLLERYGLTTRAGRRLASAEMPDALARYIAGTEQ